MPSWIIGLVIGGLLLLWSLKVKSLLARVILWMFGGMAIIGSIPDALSNPLVVTVLVIIGVIALALFIWKATKPLRKKPDDGNDGRSVQVHNHFH